MESATPITQEISEGEIKVKRKPDFLYFCLQHGFEVGDGSKNECCNMGAIMPMLTYEEMSELNNKGVEVFESDFQKLVNVMSGNISPAGSKKVVDKEVSDWFGHLQKHLDKQVPKNPLAEGAEEGILVGGVLEQTEEQEQSDPGWLHGYTQGYAEGFKAGVLEGFRIRQDLKS